ncbi:hypothetical protein DFJ77DRAFT_130141 [Powellomyces hirtus]|nr:hypothetical protein DFJ77DRAFT_130141 [Powellomyces hirtus]
MGGSGTSSPAPEPPPPAIPRGQQKKILIVLIHGFLGSEESFFQFPFHLVEELEKNHGFDKGQVETRMFPRYDTRGHNARSVQKLIDWLLVYATTGRYESVILLAHSMGGLLAADAYQYMYALHKEKVEERLDRKGHGPNVEGVVQAVIVTDADKGSSDGQSGKKEATAEGDNSAAQNEKGNPASEAIMAEGSAAHEALPSAVPEGKLEAETKVGSTSSAEAAGAEAGKKDDGPAKIIEGAATVPKSSPAGSGLAAISSWFGKWSYNKTVTDVPPPVNPDKDCASTKDGVDVDGFEGCDKTSPDSDVRLLVNIRGIITFDSPFYGLHANVITQAGTNKAVAVMSEGIFNTRAYLPMVMEHASSIAPRTIPVPTGLKGVSSVSIPTAWVMDAAKRVVGTTQTPAPASASPSQTPPNAPRTVPTPTHPPTDQSATQTETAATVKEADNPLPTPTSTTSTSLTVTSSAPSASAPTLASRVPGWIGYALGGAAVAATAYAVAPLAVAYIPASMIASSMATSFAISGAEQIRDHLHFLYPLVNSQYDMHQRVQMLQREMELRRRLTFHAFYLSLPPFPSPPAVVKTPAPSKPVPRDMQPIQMMDINDASPTEELLSLPTPYATPTTISELATLPTPYATPTPPDTTASSSSQTEAKSDIVKQKDPTPSKTTSAENVSIPLPQPAHSSANSKSSPDTSSSTTSKPDTAESDTPSSPRFRTFCNLPPIDTAHLFHPVTHPQLNEIDAHMNLFNLDCGWDWYIDLVGKTAKTIRRVVDTENTRDTDGVLRG